MFDGESEVSLAQQHSLLQPSTPHYQSRRKPYVRIIEQPASKALRFRYKCEGNSAGSIPGASSTQQKKTFPAIQIVGYQGRAVVVVSCVTKDPPYRPHPHSLVGRDGCKSGVCTLEISTDTMTVHFSNLGIQCVKRKDIGNALRVREEIRVDPFRTGFGHRNQPALIDLNAVRLCFQVFLDCGTAGKYSVPLTSVVSEPIYDKKAVSDVTIIKLSDCVSYVDGGRKDIILLCEKVAKEDIQVRFYDESEDWEAFAEFQRSQVHKQCAIWFRTPRYKTLEVTEPVKVFLQLCRPSDGATSEAVPFELLPLDSEPGILKRKRQKLYDPRHILYHLQSDSKDHLSMNAAMNNIKTELRISPSPFDNRPDYGTNISPVFMPLETRQLSEYPHNCQLNNRNPTGSNFQRPLCNNVSPQPPIWNIPSSSTITDVMTPSPSCNGLLDLDNQDLNSAEMAATLKTIGIESLPEIENLSFSDVSPN